jgi:REP element-mobilizing transposase RayT
MARPLRIEYPGAFYHVTCRGNERREIFADDRDRKRFLEILAESKEIYGVEVHGYVVMANHFHLMVMTPEANLQKFMQRFNTSYTVYFNRRHRRSGHLYQGRYKAILVDADNYLLELSRYLHLNPVRLKRYFQLEVKEKRKIIRTYPWSSYRGYVYLKHRQPFVTYSTVLEMVSGGDDREGRKGYADFVMGGILQDMNITFWQGVRGQAVLGSDDFVDWIYERFLADKKVDRKEFPGLWELRKRPETIEEIAREVAREFEVEEASLYRRRAVNRVARSVLMELSCLHLVRRMSLAAIGRELGGVSVSALSQNRSRLAERMKDDRQLRQRFQKLERALSS